MQAFRVKLPRLPIWCVILLSIVALAVIAFLMRCLHLFDSNHYYIVSPDSYFFHWLAGRFMAGQGPPAGAPFFTSHNLHYGLAYPLAYFAKGVSSVFGLSSADALSLVAKLLPPVIGVISTVLIYLFAARVCNRRVGLFAALTWSVMLIPITVGSAGFLDRDGLSTLLFMAGAFLFYLSSKWHIKVRGRDIGWLVAGVGVAVIEGLLYLEWNYGGPVLLVTVIAVYCVGRFLLEYLSRRESDPNLRRRLFASMGKVNWRTFAFIIAVNVVVAGLSFRDVPGWYHSAIGAIHGGVDTAISEEQGLSLGNLLAYQLFLIPMVVALYLAWKKRSESNIFFSCWFIGLFVLAIFVSRILLYAAPAACLLSGVGLAFLWDWAKQGKSDLLKRAGLVVLLSLVLVLSLLMAYSFPAEPAMSPDRGWQDALAYLRDETPNNSVIMTQWSYGYWILDLGQRSPVVDNGYYSHTDKKMRDVALAYCTTDPAEAAQIMKKYGANYLVFSKQDVDLYASNIMGLTNIWEGLANFPSDSLIIRSLNGEFKSGGGLEVVYRSSPELDSVSPSEPEVVILALTQT